MKYVLIFLLVMVVAWRWRAARATQQQKKKKAQSDATVVTEVLACAHCGVHVPASDAVVGDHGAYCSPAHRKQREP
jgi:uncharacterized protein